VTASLYEPICVYKPIGPNIGIVDGPFEYLAVAGIRLPLRFTTRMTVVRLSDGDQFLHSPVRFERRLADELEKLGRVRHLISPNQFHYAHIGEWADAFPDAIAWASPRVRQRARLRNLNIRFTRDLGAMPPEEWRVDLDQTLFPGGYFKEFIFLHRETRSLVVAHTIINIELDKMNEPWRTATRLTGMAYPHGRTFFGMRRRKQMPPASTRIAAIAEANIGRWMKKPTTGSPRLQRSKVSRRGMLRIRRQSSAPTAA
jgi:hypothetical protein